MNQNFKKQQKNGLFSQMERTGRFPIDPDTVVTSYTDLQDILNENDKVYPGMIIALGDDVSEPNGINVPDEDREHMGLYWVTNDASGSENFVSYKIATVADADSRSMLSYEKLWNDIHNYTTSTLDPFFNETVHTIEENIDNVSYKIDNVSYKIDKHIEEYNIFKTESIAPMAAYELVTRNMLLSMLPEEQYFPPTVNDFSLCYTSNGDGTGVTKKFQYITTSNGEKYYYANVGFSEQLYSTYSVKLIWENTAPRYIIYDVYDDIFLNTTALPSGFSLSYLGYTNIIFNRNNITDGEQCKINTAYWKYTYTIIDNETNTITYDNNIFSTFDVNDIIYSNSGYWYSYWNNISYRDDMLGLYAKWHSYDNSYYYDFSWQHYDGGTNFINLNDYVQINSLKMAGKIQLLYIDQPIYYCGAQKKLSSQLVKQNIFVTSTSGAWNTYDYNVIHFNDKINLKLSLNVYIGFKIKYGVFGLDTNISDTSKIQSIIEYLIGNTQTMPSVKPTGSKISTNNLVTGMATDILKTSNTMVYFGKNKIGIDSFDSGTKKYFFIGFPTNYFEYTKLNSDENIPQVFEAKFSGTGSWGTFGTDDTDPCNYIINNVGIKHNGTNINYTFIVAKTNLDFKFGGESSDGYGIRLTCRQKGLVDNVQPIVN